MIRKEPEVLPEGIDPEEKIEITKEVTMVEEIPALIEGNMLLREGAGGTTVLIEGEREVEGTTLLIKGGDTLVKIEGVARDPWV